MNRLFIGLLLIVVAPVLGLVTGCAASVAVMIDTIRVPMSKLFPCALILMDLGAATVCAFEFDWRRTIYWVVAAALTTVVTF